MVIEKEVHKGTPVFTADGVSLGQAVVLFRRREDISPALKLYEFYLKVVDLKMGDEFYIPTDFIDESSDADGLKLVLTMAEVQAETMMRMPRVVGLRQAERIELAPGQLVTVP